MLAVSYFGWGSFGSKLLGIAESPRTETATTVLLGWSFSLLVLQLLNFVLPIDGRVAIPVSIAGLLMCAPQLRRRSNRVTNINRTAVRAVAGSFCIVAVWVAARGLYHVENYDSGLYHMPTIKWVNAFAIVPGLGNLHGRLAFNQSFFTYAAALDGGWFAGHTGGAANGFLFLVVLAQVVQGLAARLIGAKRESMSGPLAWAANLLILPVLLYLGLSSDGMSSPTPDLAATLLELSMFLLFVRGLGRWRTPGESQDFAATILPIFAATAITVKLSTIAFSASMVAASVLYEIDAARRGNGTIRRIILRLLPAAIIMIVWAIRGMILSGCPLYPSTAGCIAVDWAIPTVKVQEEANWVFSWAREPGVHWRIVLGNSNWMRAWIVRESRDVIGFAFPLIAAVVLIATSVWIRRPSKRGASFGGFRDLVLVIPILLGIGFWFAMAPDPRFGRAFFWMLSIAGALSMLVSLERILDARRLHLATILLVAGANAPFVAYALFKGGPRMAMISLSGWQPVPTPVLTANPTISGLTLYVPVREQRCWNSPIPCTPYFNPDLALRVPGNMGRGFVDRSTLPRSAMPPSP